MLAGGPEIPCPYLMEGIFDSYPVTKKSIMMPPSVAVEIAGKNPFGAVTFRTCQRNPPMMSLGERRAA